MKGNKRELWWGVGRRERPQGTKVAAVNDQIQNVNMCRCTSSEEAQGLFFSPKRIMQQQCHIYDNLETEISSLLTIAVDEGLAWGYTRGGGLA